MTRKEAERATNLDSRENPDARYEYLRCLLGEKETVMVQTSAWRSVSSPVFRLVAFGETWEDAVEMWEKQQKKPQFAL